MKKILCLVLSLLLLSSFTPRSTLASETFLFTDSVGRTVELPSVISRIAPSGPLAQMVLLSLAPERFVGLSSAIHEEAVAYLPSFDGLPTIGTLYGTRGELNLEELVRLDPQVIIDVGDAKSTIKEDMDALQEQLGIPCVHIAMRLENAGEAYRLLGQLLNIPQKAEELADYSDKVWQRAKLIEQQVAGDKVSLLYSLGEAGLNVIARDSYHSEVIDLVADNAAVLDNPTSKGTGNEVDMEQLYVWDPDFIIFAPDSMYSQAAQDPLWQGLRAIREGHYAQAPSVPYNWMGFPASVQRFLGLVWLQKLLYPQAADYDLQEEITEYFRLFYGSELSQLQYNDLMKHAMPE